MADQSAENILAAARKRARTKSVDLGDGVAVIVRELPRKELRVLMARCWEVDAAGYPLIFDKPDKDGVVITTGTGWRHPNGGVNITREWLLATLSPVEAVEGLMADDIPESVVEDILAAAKALNGESASSAAGN